MSVDIVQKYGPGLSYYLAQVKQSVKKDTAANWSSSSVRKFSATLKALHASNERLEASANKLCTDTIQLEFDLMKLQRHVQTFHGELLVTWQADTLTRLVEVVYERHGWKFPGGITPTSHGEMDQASLTLMYRTAARKIKRETLKRRFGLSVKYYLALQKYDDIVHLRSINSFRSECPFARFLISQKEKNRRPGLVKFWGRLFPLCYGRTVQETSEMF
ncbi:hypothetical protein BBP40_012169 [Aspergillus hancockii]|nr:hypothetical protein BBP40_012169 [Aspergillus hancockii]